MLTRLAQRQVVNNQWTWSEGSLLQALRECLTTSGRAILIFIDGLDEFHGQCSSLVEMLEGLKGIHAIKMCLSSRPDNNLPYMLSRYPHVEMEQYNFPDIQRYVDSNFLPLIGSVESGGLNARYGKLTLAKDQLKHLAARITKDSSGVFLWTALVTSELVVGVQAGYSYGQLLRLLNETPKDIHDLIQGMLKKLNSVQREFARYYFSIMLQHDKLSGLDSVPIITAARSPRSLDSHRAFTEECETTVKELKMYTAGLISTTTKAGAKLIGIQKSSPDKFTYWAAPAWTSNDTDKKRRVIDTSLVEETVWPYLQYDSMSLVWIHASAYDVVREWFGSILEQAADSSGHVIRQCVEAALRYLMFVPSWFSMRKDEVSQELISHESETEMRLLGLTLAIPDNFEIGEASKDAYLKQIYKQTRFFAQEEMRCNLPYSAEQSSPLLCFANILHLFNIGSAKLRSALEREILADPQDLARCTAWLALRVQGRISYIEEEEDAKELLLEYNTDAFASGWQAAHVALSRSALIRQPYDTAPRGQSSTSLPVQGLAYFCYGFYGIPFRLAVFDAVLHMDVQVKHALANIHIIVCLFIWVYTEGSSSHDVAWLLEDVTRKIATPTTRLGLMAELDCSPASDHFSIYMPLIDLLSLLHSPETRYLRRSFDIADWIDSDTGSDSSESSRQVQDSEYAGEPQTVSNLASAGPLRLVFRPDSSRVVHDSKGWAAADEPTSGCFSLQVTDEAGHISRALASCKWLDPEVGQEAINAGRDHVKGLLLDVVASATGILTPPQQASAKLCIESWLPDILASLQNGMELAQYASWPVRS